MTTDTIFTDKLFTDQQEVTGLGIYNYQARFYSPYLNHFTQADSIVPSGIQGYDRYAAMENNPVRYADPTGHMVSDGLGEGGGCDRQCWDERNPSSTPQEILVCGYGAANACLNQTNDPNYSNQIPLSNVANWAGNGNFKYFAANSSEEKEIAAKAILDFMLSTIAKNNEATFIFVGHSAGADTVVWAVRLFLEGGGDPSRIRGVVLLDSYLYTGDGTPVGKSERDTNGNLTGPLNNQNSGNLMVQADIPVLSLASQDKINEEGDHLTDFPNLATPLNVGGGHFALAVDVTIFNSYIKPFLEGIK